ncbi:response regulator [Leptospirillum ferriphilum]|jgi:CheY-like chemotaxis protein|uniref:Sensory transduction regulatory protein n=2 Tax=Leptospirillum TaxID=179 RepID=A0A094W6I6_9BACT|nr:response regulator [Leptospirillum ferriphilum]EDZ39225.1 MAG: Putative response regulator receiver protein [Leptospirillum sp. Group II '5-way CG']KGA93038.1 sensory transduction regulatory protein [Leptospirillum ferriphilum]
MADCVESVEILLVEDNPDDAELTRRALQKHHFINMVTWVKDGEEALAYLYGSEKFPDRPDRPPRLILLDFKLPKLDGIEVLRRIKSDENLKHIPVVMLTSSNEERDLVDAYRLGVNSYIVKPVEFEEFVKTVSGIGFYWVLTNRVPDC